MSKILSFVFLLSVLPFFGQEKQEFKKKVLEKIEVDMLMSYYAQDGENSSVGGGIGTEELWDVTPTIIISMPLNADDVLTLDVGISAYTSASSSNLNPFDSGASGSGEDDDEDDDKNINDDTGLTTGTPWMASSGASKSDVLTSVSIAYDHSSDSRNSIWSAHAAFSAEYDYTSIGFGGGFTQLFNQKNTEISVKANVYLDKWSPLYPTELKSFEETNGNLNEGFFEDVDIWAETGGTYNPVKFVSFTDKARNSYSLSWSFSQILSKKLQTSVFMDVVKQGGLLSTPYHRIYFEDYTNKFFIGNPETVFDPNQAYDDPSNKDSFMLADDVEKLPNNRLKLPIGMRLHYYINEFLTIKNYYRFYWDDWGILAHTYSVELPIKLGKGFTMYPTYRYYTQNQADYFAPFNKHQSTETYYTSDFDLSAFTANQYGMGLKYTDLLSKAHIWKFGLKSIDLRYNHYERTTGLKADIISGGVKFVLD